MMQIKPCRSLIADVLGTDVRVDWLPRRKYLEHLGTQALWLMYTEKILYSEWKFEFGWLHARQCPNQRSTSVAKDLKPENILMVSPDSDINIKD